MDTNVETLQVIQQQLQQNAEGLDNLLRSVQQSKYKCGTRCQAGRWLAKWLPKR